METFIADLEKILNDEMECEEFHNIYYHSDKFPIADLMSNLVHYLDDDDIRGKDSNYKEFQNVEMEKLIYCLKNDRIEEAIKEISFLSESKIKIQN